MTVRQVRVMLLSTSPQYPNIQTMTSQNQEVGVKLHFCMFFVFNIYCCTCSGLRVLGRELMQSPEKEGFKQSSEASSMFPGSNFGMPGFMFPFSGKSNKRLTKRNVIYVDIFQKVLDLYQHHPPCQCQERIWNRDLPPAPVAVDRYKYSTLRLTASFATKNSATSTS